MTNVPDDIGDAPLAELRVKLVNTALAYKNEQVRNNIFERKLDGARMQLKKREAVIQEISDMQEENAQRSRQLQKMERERERDRTNFPEVISPSIELGDPPIHI